MASRTEVFYRGPMRWTLCVSLVVLLGACTGDEPPAPPTVAEPTGAPVVLISIDTLRSDRLPAYGYDGVETPAIDGLRRDGILFERAYSSSPLTLPSHVSILTGLLPTGHGARDNIGYPVRPDLHPMLQQWLSDAGYATGAGVSAWVLRADTGIAAGFDHYDDRLPPSSRFGVQAVQRPGTETLAAVLPWLREVADQPFFLFLHLFEPHSPYAAPEPFGSRYQDPYDGEIAAADAIVGQLVHELRDLSVYDDALIILLSDHGEGLGDHGEREHGVFLYRSTVQVPLILKTPGGERAGDAVSRPVGLVDVARTVLSEAGLPIPETVGGRSLLEFDAPDAPARPLYAETLYPRLHFGWSDLAAVVQGDHQYIGAPRPELYDLVKDPDQVDNRIDRDTELAVSLADALGRWDRGFELPGSVDAEERERLEALGYVASTAVAAAGPLPDPKDRIHVLEDLRIAQSLLERGDAAAAANQFGEVLRREPGIEDAWVLFIRALRSAGDRRRALGAMAEARRSLPDSDAVGLEAASLLMAEERFDEAEPLANAAIDYDPATARVLLAQIHLSRGDIEAAERAARQATEDGPDRSEPWLLLAEILARANRIPDAVEVLAGVAGNPVRPTATRLDAAQQLFRQGYASQGGDAIGDLISADEPEALLLLARDAVQREDWVAARARLESYLEVRNSDASAIVDLGLVHLALNETAKARHRLESGLAMEPSLAAGWNALGVLLAESGDLDGAIRAWKGALEADPGMVSVHYNLAMALSRAGRPAEAAGHLEALAATRDGDERDRLLGMASQLRAQAGR
jgi:choline-sulfatase